MNEKQTFFSHGQKNLLIGMLTAVVMILLLQNMFLNKEAQVSQWSSLRPEAMQAKADDDADYMIDYNCEIAMNVLDGGPGSQNPGIVEWAMEGFRGMFAPCYGHNGRVGEDWGIE